MSPHRSRATSCVTRTRLALLVSGALLMSATAACSSEDANREVIGDRITAVWRAAGADPDAAQVLGYQRTRRPRAAACADLPEDERWWGKQTSTLPGGTVRQAELLGGVADRLEAEGYEVRRFRSTGSETRVLDALSTADDVYLQLYVTADGSASLDVKAGPCATRMQAEPGPPYVAET